MAKAATLRIQRLPLAELRPHPRNPRRHPEPGTPAWNALKASLAHDYFDPLIYNKRNRMLVSGHLRVKVLKEMGFTAADVVVVDYDEPTHLARLVAANRAIGEDDQDLLAKLLGDLDGASALTGIAADELKALLEAGAPDEDTPPRIDEALALQKKWKTKTGQLWALGEHRLLCGDCSDADAREKLLDGDYIGLCFTSPPYLQQRDYGEIIEDWDLLMRGAFNELPVAEDGQVLVNLGLVYSKGEWVSYWDQWIESMREQGWRRFGWYVWDQGPGMPGDWSGRLAPSFEFVWHFNRISVKPTKARPCKHAGKLHGGKGQRSAAGDVKPRSAGHERIQSSAILDSVIRVNRQGASHDAYGHPAPFPVGLPTAILKSWPGDVYDPFLGSGTTLIACENLGRRCFGIEIAPRYVAVSLQRWAEHTGRVPSLL